MHSYLLATLIAASSVAAAPAATATTATYPTPTFTCAKGLTPYIAHFDDEAPVANGTRAHLVNPSGKPSPNVYKNLHYGNTDWYIVSPGYMQIPFKQNDPTNEVEGYMTTHHGNAIINGEPVPYPIAVMYGNDYFNLKSLWVRSHSAAAFTLEIACWSYNAQGTTTEHELLFDVPAVPLATNNGYYKVQLTGAQQGVVAKARECLFGDKNRNSFTLMDDIEYCYYKAPGNPY